MRFMDEVMKDTQRAGVTEEDAKDETIQTQMMHCSDPYREEPKQKEDIKCAVIYVSIVPSCGHNSNRA